MIRIIAILAVWLIACNSKSNSNSKVNKYTAVFQTADSIGISYRFADSTTTIISTIYKKDKDLLADIADVFNSKETNCSCASNGYINVYSKDTIALNIRFAIESDGKDCAYLLVKEDGKEKCYVLTYRIGMYLSEKREFIKP